MLVGLTVGSVSSCGMFDQLDEDTKVEDCVVKCENEEGEFCWENCPGCGMG